MHLWTNVAVFFNFSDSIVGGFLCRDRGEIILFALLSIDASLRFWVSVNEKQTDGQYVRISTTKAKYNVFAALMVSNGLTRDNNLSQFDAFLMTFQSD